jgi:hypothetical protein
MKISLLLKRFNRKLVMAERVNKEKARATEIIQLKK